MSGDFPFAPGCSPGYGTCVSGGFVWPSLEATSGDGSGGSPIDLAAENALLREAKDLLAATLGAKIAELNDTVCALRAELRARDEGVKSSLPAKPKTLPANYAARPPRNYVARLMARGMD